MKIWKVIPGVLNAAKACGCTRLPPTYMAPNSVPPQHSRTGLYPPMELNHRSSSTEDVSPVEPNALQCHRVPGSTTLEGFDGFDKFKRFDRCDEFEGFDTRLDTWEGFERMARNT